MKIASLVEHRSRSFTLRENGKLKQLPEVGCLLPPDEVPVRLKVPPGHAAVLVVHAPRRWSHSSRFRYETWPLVDFRPYKMKPVPSPNLPEEFEEPTQEGIIQIEELTPA